jgi:hypothetical protein
MLDESTIWNVVFSVFWFRLPPPPRWCFIALLINTQIYSDYLRIRKGYLMVNDKMVANFPL